MKTIWIAAPAALVMMSGVAFADNLFSEETHTNTTTTVTKTTPPASTYNSTESQSSVDANGTATEKSQTYHSDCQRHECDLQFEDHRGGWFAGQRHAGEEGHHA